MALLAWQKGVVIRIEQETPNTRRYWIQTENSAPFDFTPGQFVSLDLPIHEKPNRRLRSYSIASWPNGTNVFELVIVLLENGAGSTWIFENVAVGTELSFRGPMGVFTLREKHMEHPLFLICTGTGIAPFRSMVQHIHYTKQTHPPIHLIFGCRKKEDLLYHDELKALEKEMDGFYFHPTLSREEWEGKTGYVHPIYESLCKEKQPAHFFLCGWKAMIEEARQRIEQMGYDRKAIELELYG